MFALVNTRTNEIVFIGKTPTQCTNYAFKKKLIFVERGTLCNHVLWGYWDVQKLSARS